MGRSLGLAAYLAFSARAEGWAERKLETRLADGKEDPERLDERKGIASIARPQGPLLWFHAASVGESLALLEVIRVISEAHPGLNLLVTTGTRTSAELMANRLPKNALHQFVPVDARSYVCNFLDHWQPDLAIWTESEFWPRILHETHKRGTPLVSINARISKRSHDRWRWFPGFMRSLLRRFSLILAQDDETRRYLNRLGAAAGTVITTGTLKESARPLVYDEAERARFAEVTAGREVWFAASTHPGEEEIVVAAHAIARRATPDLLLILAPRHPERGDALTQTMREEGWNVAQRSAGDPMHSETEIYLADTLGEMGLWYRLAPVSLVGGSLVDLGGHNPYEPAGLGSAILYGPYVRNFATVYERLTDAGGAIPVSDAPSLASAVSETLRPDIAARAATAAWDVSSEGAGVTDLVLTHLEPHLAKLPR